MLEEEMPAAGLGLMLSCIWKVWRMPLEPVVRLVMLYAVDIDHEQARWFAGRYADQNTRPPRP